MGTINVENYGQVSIHSIPDTCPLCGVACQPVGKWVGCVRDLPHAPEYRELLMVFGCPSKKCGESFIALYHSNDRHHFSLSEVYPKNHQKKDFHESIPEISGNFVEIYDQSIEADSQGLHHLAGMGLRKALEFLIKDYAIKRFPLREEEIRKEKTLHNCIEKYTAENIKAMAFEWKWLGNEETHYEKAADINHFEEMKLLVDLTLHWIQMEWLTEQAKGKFTKPKS